jgi:L-histidine Nalpha-methyltransferase / hercynylcysteine S-oxide synthase
MTVVTPLKVALDSVRDTVKLKTIEPYEETILDIRRDTEEHSILQDVKDGLRPKVGEEKTLPTLLLYDVDGLKLFEKITYLDEYYLTNAEIEVLETYADNIAERIKPNSIVVELGSG